MAKYLLLDSCGAPQPAMFRSCADLAMQLVQSGHDVSLFLYEEGVVPVCSAMTDSPLCAALASGVEVVADERSLRERGLLPCELYRGVRVAGLCFLVERLASGWRALQCDESV